MHFIIYLVTTCLMIIFTGLSSASLEIPDGGKGSDGTG